MTITKVNCPANKIAMKCPYSQVPQDIVMHNTYGRVSAMSEISYMLGNDKYVSFHYAADNERIVQGIDENRCAWHAGNYPENLKSIGIEICYSLTGGDIFESAENNAAELVADILTRYGWGIDRVRYHKEFANTSCPHRTLELGWERFLNKVREKIGQVIIPTTPVSPSFNPYRVKITATPNLRKRSESNTSSNSNIIGSLNTNTIVTIIDKNGNWGKLEDGSWISLNWTTPYIETPTSNYSTGTYKVTSNIGVNVRNSANGTKISGLAFNTIVEIDTVKGNWGRCNAGWVCLDYLQKTSTIVPTSGSYSKGRYKVNTTEGLRVRTGAGTNYSSIKTYPNGTIFDTYQISGNWAKTPSRMGLFRLCKTYI